MDLRPMPCLAGLSFFADVASFPVSGYKFRKSCRCRCPCRPPRLVQRCRFALTFGPKEDCEQGEIDPAQGPGPAISSAQDEEGLPT